MRPPLPPHALLLHLVSSSRGKDPVEEMKRAKERELRRVEKMKWGKGLFQGGRGDEEEKKID